MSRKVYSYGFETGFTTESKVIKEFWIIEEGSIRKGGWCNAILGMVVHIYNDGNTITRNGAIPEDVEQLPMLLTNATARLLRPISSPLGVVHMIKLYDREYPTIAEYTETYAKHIRVNHREPENLIWFYEKSRTEWLIQFGEDGNTQMRDMRVPPEAIQEILGEYTMLHDTDRGTLDPSDP